MQSIRIPKSFLITQKSLLTSSAILVCSLFGYALYRTLKAQKRQSKRHENREITLKRYRRSKQQQEQVEHFNLVDLNK